MSPYCLRWLSFKWVSGFDSTSSQQLWNRLAHRTTSRKIYLSRSVLHCRCVSSALHGVEKLGHGHFQYSSPLSVSHSKGRVLHSLSLAGPFAILRTFNHLLLSPSRFDIVRQCQIRHRSCPRRHLKPRGQRCSATFRRRTQWQYAIS